jgi:guanine deaminase
MTRLAVVGTAYHTPGADRLEVLADMVIAVDDRGTIVAVEPADSPSGHELVASATEVVRLGADRRLLPGLVDLHVHAPQWPQLGTGLDIPLERWLFEYTFPLEACYADHAFATEVYSHLVPTLLAHGTTTAVYYSSVHEDATVVLAEQCVAHGQRAFVGRVAMDHPEGTPDWYRDVDAAAGVAATARSIDAVRAVAGGPDALVQPIITPRFVPACTDDMLRELGALAEATGVRVQTHCSESDWEHGYVLERHGISDTESLHGFGLVCEHTVLAHGDHLGASDLAVIARAGAGVAHCPLSNAYFANAVFGVRRALDAGVRVGLGTDVAGGASPSLLGQCGHAVTVSRLLDDGVDAAVSATERGVLGSRIDTTTAFFLATAGGADVLGLPVGRFVPGASFDAISVAVDGSTGSGLRRWGEVDDETRLFEKVVRLAGPADLDGVWVSGRRVR